MASYKRNNYKYIAGHYQKQKLTKLEAEIIPVSTEVKTSVQTLEDRVEKMSKVNVPSITNAALGSLAASTAINGAKRLFAPNSLPATKGDIDKLKNDINELKQLINNNKSGFGVY
ncbi:hypothetical protein [Confluentibacter citreus]|uniref:hypothetical protein n=1 Tax=Confluentibacter citreus TaxID=2007307 RepID=UPI000C2839FE|nr:hypothetical protein [Confluentibacter citreus]